MERFKLSRPVKYIVSILLIVVMLAAVVGLNIAVQNTTSTKSAQTSQKETKLDVAIVNEDQSVESDGQSYNLGSSYIKTIERDETHNWSVVSRGTAEAGLKSGDYQLIIFIPSDFSKKVLDINNVNVEKTTVTYKVNASGNLQVENEANKLAKDVVSDLNAQLVDMYMASILSNLYTAQENVQAIANTQSTNIGNYKANLYDSALAFQDVFPSLVSSSNSSLEANNSLNETIASSLNLYQTLSSSQDSFRTSLESLISQRASNDITYTEFTSALMEMNQSVLSDELSSLISSMETEQTELSTKLGTVTTDTDGQVLTSGYEAYLAELDSQIATLEQNIADEQNKLQSQISAIDTYVEQEIANYYGTSLDSVTLADILDKDTSLTYSVSDYTSDLNNLMQSMIATLPSADLSAVTASMEATDVNQITAYTSQAQSYVTNNGKSFNSSLLTGLQTAYTTMKNKESDEAKYQAAQTASSSSSTSSPASLSISDPGSIVSSWELTVEGVTTNHAVSDSVPVDLSKGYSVKINYSYTTAVTNTTTTDASATTTTSSSSTSGTGTTTSTSHNTTGDVTLVTTVNGKSTTSTPSFDYNDYLTAVADYHSKAQAVIDAYNTVGKLIDTYYPTGTSSLTDKFLNQPAKTLLKDLLTDAITNNLSAYSSAVAADNKLTETLTSLKATKADLETQLASIKTNSEQLASQISSQLALVSSLQEKANSVSTAQASSDEAQKSSTADLSSLSDELQSLLSSTSSVEASSQATSTEASGVNDIFSNFNQQVQNAQSSGQALSTDAASLMNEFEAELNESGDFVSSFVKVLNNAYSNGVANEVLLDFLSNPVAETSSSVKATVNVYRPFTWILLLEVVTLFTAYIFATQNLVKKVKDKFKVDHFYNTDLLNVLILSFLSLIVGLVLGIVSADRLAIESEYQPSWVLLVVLFAFILVHGQYLFIKNFKAIGMGLALFMIISFVYLSNAIGTTASLTGFPQFLKTINPLSMLETKLSAYFDGTTASLAFIIITIIAIVFISVTNVFVTLTLPGRSATED
ncbi:type VII secretion protein EsaA [Streptococcus loxodontisalivarius]|uniref:Type VII secretion system accessory factor EsaA n=1 Tax=Streptococcus loxodontisalivarius TaxID=1349415 RepID=A0ABS2PSP6_9STRE|nr:type VII secretion protein EsaA [Streptococcus loxodontisalivarius]MBM7643063.1 type VII secretion EsaA-like protein [Streptococcus loxodontisalivarius]